MSFYPKVSKENMIELAKLSKQTEKSKSNNRKKFIKQNHDKKIN